MKYQLYSEVDHLAQRIGAFIQYWGFKKVHGRVWCHIFLSKNPLCSTELIKRLGVSKALMSQTVKELIDYDVISTVEKNKKSCCYISNLNLGTVIMAILRKREKRLISEIGASCKNIKDMSDEQLNDLDLNKDNLLKLSQMINYAEKFLCSVLKLSEFRFMSLDKMFNFSNKQKKIKSDIE